MWRLIGGGDITLSSIALVMVADLFSEEEMYVIALLCWRIYLFALRATALFRLTSTVIVSEVLATPVSAYLMASDPWLPFMLGLGVSTLGSLAAFLMPETLNDAKSKIDLTTVTSEDETQSSLNGKTSVKQYIKGRFQDLQDSARLIIGSPAIAICLFALFVTSISKQSTSLLLLYTSKRFNWSIADVSDIMAVTFLSNKLR